jgi:hypothetical protein
MANCRNNASCIMFCFKLGKTYTAMREVQPWFTVVTKKPNSGHLTGEPFPLHIWRKQAKSVQTSRSCLACLGCERTFDQELVSQSQMVNSIATWRFCNVWGGNSAKNTLNDGGRTHWFTMTVCLYILLSLSMMQFLTTKKYCCVPPTHPTSLNWTLLTSCFWEC